MDNIITIDVRSREVLAVEQQRPIVAGNVGVDFVDIALDEEWDGLTKRVTFSNAGVDVTVPFETPLEIPHECLTHGYLSISVVGVDADGEEVLRTKAMRKPLVVNASGADMGGEAAPRTMDVAALAEKRLDALEATIPAVEADWASVKAAQASEFTSAQTERSETFATDLAAWNKSNQRAAEIARDAAADAVEAAIAANNTAANLSERVDAGEFNGAPFTISYTPASIAALNAIQGAKQGEFAVINSNAEDPDNAKLFMFGNGVWNYMSDLSGATGFGLQGKQGVSLKNVEVRNLTQVWVTQHDPMTEQDRTYMVGDFAAPLAAGVAGYVDSKWQVVDAMPAEPVPGVIYFVRE